MTVLSTVLPTTAEHILMGKTDPESKQHRIMLQTQVPVRGVETELGIAWPAIGTAVSGLFAPLGQWLAAREYQEASEAAAAAQVEAARIQTAGMANVARTMAPVFVLGTIGAIFLGALYLKKKPASATGG